MRRFPTTLFVIFITIVGLAIVYFMYWKTETSRIKDVAKLHQAPSRIYADMLVRYDHPPVFEEEYKMSDIEGVSTFSYRIRSYEGKQITISPARPEAMFDVSFFFGALDQDGVWQIVNKPPKGNTSIHYTVFVKQDIDFKEGIRTVTFTDPHYWATTAGRQYQIDLSKNRPQDLLKLNSTSLADPHYQKVVDDFREFGPASFRERVARAQASLGLKP